MDIRLFLCMHLVSIKFFTVISAFIWIEKKNAPVWGVSFNDDVALRDAVLCRHSLADGSGRVPG
jgi:hypothetical protein